MTTQEQNNQENNTEKKASKTLNVLKGIGTGIVESVATYAVPAVVALTVESTPVRITVGVISASHAITKTTYLFKTRDERWFGFERACGSKVAGWFKKAEKDQPEEQPAEQAA